MIKLKFEGKFKVIFFKEKDEENVVAYCPMLDLATCENTIVKAKENFVECLRIYLEETVKHGTLEKDLMKLGWKPNILNLTMSPPHKETCRNIPLHILKRIDIPVPLRLQ